jgi:hypothetical protein
MAVKLQMIFWVICHVMLEVLSSVLSEFTVCIFRLEVKMEAVGSSKVLVNACDITWLINPQVKHLNLSCSPFCF